MGSFKLGKMTLGGLFKKPETTLYPIEKKTPPPGLKGHVVNHIDDCILCGICMRRCPTGALTVERSEDIWSIDRFHCIQCYSCVRECPRQCLSMEPEYHFPSEKKFVSAYRVPPRKKPTPATKPAAPAAEEKEAPKAEESSTEKPSEA